MLADMHEHWCLTDNGVMVAAGVSNTELWNNLGLCCFYASQHDMALRCFDHAFALADDSSVADVWYNIGQVAIGMATSHDCKVQTSLSTCLCSSSVASAVASW